MDAKVMQVDKLSDDTFEQHDYQEGKWKRDDRYHYETRTDTCTKCGLERNLLRSEHTDYKPMVSSYWRNKAGFARDNEPICWGQLNP